MEQRYSLRCIPCHKTIEITEGIGMAFPQKATVDGELRVWQCRTCGKIENTADLSVRMVKDAPHIHCHICREPEDGRIYHWAPVCPHSHE